LRRYDTLLEARRQFEQAIELDPQYAQAYAGLAETILVTLSNHQSIEASEANELAGAAIKKALEIDDQLAEAYATLGLLESGNWDTSHRGDRNAAAADAFERAIELNPNLANAYVWYSSLYESDGQIEKAIDMLTTAMEIDPLGRIPYINLPGFYSAHGENEKAIQLLLKAMNIFPDWPTPYNYMARQLRGLGRLDESVAWTVIAESMSDDPMMGMEAIPAYIEFGFTDRVELFGQDFGSDHPMYPIGAGFMQFAENDFEQSISTFESLEIVSKIQAEIAYPMLTMASLKLGDYGKAWENLVRANPSLASDTNASVGRKNLKAAILMAYILRQTDRDRLASDLLTQAWKVVQEMPRIGAAGHGISDVHILAIQGRKEAALDALREAIDEGFVSLLVYEFWTFDQDVLIDSLRGDPRFEDMQLELHEKIDAMRKNVQEAEDSGDWSDLLDSARGQLTAAVSRP
jgi:tetratricopeptide (TPR) repeat protein